MKGIAHDQAKDLPAIPDTVRIEYIKTRRYIYALAKPGAQPTHTVVDIGIQWHRKLTKYGLLI